MNLLNKLITSLFTKRKSTPKETIQQGNTSSNAILGSNSADLLSATREVKDQSYFSRKNNLVAEFAYTPIPVYRGPQDKEPMGWLDANGNIIRNREFAGEPKIERYKGYVIQYFNEAELANHKVNIDYRLHNALSMTPWLSEEEFIHLKQVNQAGEELLKDDVALVKDIHKPYSSEEKKNPTYIIQADPNMKIKAEEQVKQIQDMENNLRSKLGMPIDAEDQAEMQDDTDTKNVMVRAAEKYIEDNGIDEIVDKNLQEEMKDYSKDFGKSSQTLSDKEKQPNINNIP
jgi:hypothetical protein